MSGEGCGRTHARGLPDWVPDSRFGLRSVGPCLAPDPLALPLTRGYGSWGRGKLSPLSDLLSEYHRRRRGEKAHRGTVCGLSAQIGGIPGRRGAIRPRARGRVGRRCGASRAGETARCASFRARTRTATPIRSSCPVLCPPLKGERTAGQQRANVLGQARTVLGQRLEAAERSPVTPDESTRHRASGARDSMPAQRHRRGGVGESPDLVAGRA